MNYLLTPDGVPVREPDILKWARGFEKLDRRVGFDRIGPYRVSTVFLGLDHGQNPSEPQVWETMVFGSGSSLDLEQERCSGTKTDAEAMHRAMCDRVRQAITDGKEL